MYSLFQHTLYRILSVLSIQESLATSAEIGWLKVDCLGNLQETPKLLRDRQKSRIILF